MYNHKDISRSDLSLCTQLAIISQLNLQVIFKYLILISWAVRLLLWTVPLTLLKMPQNINSWATKTSAVNGQLFSISFWYTPQNNCAMTMAEVAGIIESNIGIRIGRILARGRIIHRSELGNYVAADILKDGEDFTLYCIARCCTVLWLQNTYLQLTYYKRA